MRPMAMAFWSCQCRSLHLGRREVIRSSDCWPSQTLGASALAIQGRILSQRRYRPVASAGPRQTDKQRGDGQQGDMPPAPAAPTSPAARGKDAKNGLLKCRTASKARKGPRPAATAQRVACSEERRASLAWDVKGATTNAGRLRLPN